MDNELKEMSFWDHVDDLRRVILRSVGAIILLSVVFFTLMPRIFDSISLRPVILISYYIGYFVT